MSLTIPQSLQTLILWPKNQHEYKKLEIIRNTNSVSCQTLMVNCLILGARKLLLLSEVLVGGWLGGLLPFLYNCDVAEWISNCMSCRGERERLFGSRELEGKLEITFPFYEKGTGIRKCHGRGNLRLVFPGITGNGNSRSPLWRHPVSGRWSSHGTGSSLDLRWNFPF